MIIANISSKCEKAGIKGWRRWHSFYIVHGTGSSDVDFMPNGHSSWFLHADRLAPNIKTEIQAKGHAFVQSGDPIAYVGCYGPTINGSICTETLLHMCGTGLSPHLHFEVRNTHFDAITKLPDGLDDANSVVDPYADDLWLR